MFKKNFFIMNTLMYKLGGISTVNVLTTNDLMYKLGGISIVNQRKAIKYIVGNNQIDYALA